MKQAECDARIDSFISVYGTEIVVQTGNLTAFRIYLGFQYTCICVQRSRYAPSVSMHFLISYLI